jgi:hypothetical protein
MRLQRQPLTIWLGRTTTHGACRFSPRTARITMDLFSFPRS